MCPNCGSQIHVRKLACPCDHVFHGSKPFTTRNVSRRSNVGAARTLETGKQTAKCRKSDRERVKETRALEADRNELILKCVPYQLESKHYDTIVHKTMINSS